MSPKNTIELLCVAAAVCTMSGVIAHAEQPPASADQTINEAVEHEQCLLLTNDRILFGKVRKQGNDFVYIRRGKAVVVPAHRVAYRADSRDEVYRFKASRLPEYDLDERFKLSNWCMANNLNEQALAEYELILRFDPANKRAARLAKSMRRKLHPEDHPAPASRAYRTMAKIPAKPSDVVNTWIRGHGAKSFELYKSKVEPILVNHCATAGCHGSFRHTSPFRIYHGRKGRAIDQTLTAKNLMSLRKVIDLDDPLNSKLLYESIEAHGRQEIPAFGGVSDPMYQQLHDWVFSVARTWAVDERGLTVNADRLRSEAGYGAMRADVALAKDFVRPRRGPRTPGDDLPSPGFSASAAADDAPPTQRTRTLGASKPRTITDPFDPSGFNRRSAPTRESTNNPARKSVGKPGVGSRGTSSAIRSTVEIPTDNKGGVFKAAAAPFSFRSGKAKTKTPR